MRANRLLAAALLLIAGCAPQQKKADNGVDEVAALPASQAPTPAAPAPAPAPDATIPAAFHGVFDSSKKACGRPSDGRLRVSALELRFHESIGSVRSVAPAPAGAIRVEADYQGEGERWRSRRDLLLSGDGATLTVSGDGTRMVRVRCPQGDR